MSKPLVIFHGNCPDGAFAAWVAWHAICFGRSDNHPWGPPVDTSDQIELRPWNYSDPEPELDLVRDRDVYVLDFSFKRPWIQAARSVARSLIVLDHHKTAREDLEGESGCVFDMDHSGVMLAWRHFYPNEAEEPYELLRYIEDRDLWRFALPKSREVSAAIRLHEWTDMCVLEGLVLNGAAPLAEQGATALRLTEQQVEIMAKRAVLVLVAVLPDSPVVPMVNATCFFSEVGERMCELHPDAPFSLYYFDRPGARQWGIRSRRKDYDATPVARAFGGGGHPQACGFTTDPGAMPFLEAK